MATTRIREGVHNLSDQQVTDFREAYRQMQSISDNRSYGFFGGLHGVPGFWCWHHERNAARSPGVRMQIFLPWHRAYLYHFEMAARDRVGNVTLPWWDWTLRPPRQDGLPQIFAERTVSGQRNPLFSFRINLPTGPQPIVRDTQRDPSDVNELPTQSDVDNVTGSADWTDFNSILEGIHDSVHGWVGGDMGQVATSAYDPIFWSHHCMIDRIWWLWQVRNGNGNIPDNLLDVVLSPFNFTVRDVLNVNDLGYDYAAAQAVVPIGG
jgi:tyrosinase